MKKTMLIVNDFIYAGGVEKLMLDFVKQWHVKYDITILASKRYRQYEKYYPSDVKWLQLYPQQDFGQTKGMRRFGKILVKLHQFFLFYRINSRKYDVLLAMKEGRIMKTAAPIQAKRKLAWVHLDYINAYWTNSVFQTREEELECMKKYDHVVCVSKYVKESILQRLGNPGNLIVKYNPIDVEEIMEKARFCKAFPHRKPEEVIFLSVGRLHNQKGYDILLEACRQLNVSRRDYRLYILGDGPEREKLYAKKRELELDNVHFMGQLENPYPYIAEADWFLSSSRYEGYSLVSQEAAVLGTPMLVTDCSGVRELLGDAEYGIIMKCSVDSIRESMEQVLKHRELREVYRKKIEERRANIEFKNRAGSIEDLFGEK